MLGRSHLHCRTKKVVHQITRWSLLDNSLDGLERLEGWGEARTWYIDVKKMFSI